MMVTGMTDILDAVHHIWLKTHNILGAGSVFVFRWQRKGGGEGCFFGLRSSNKDYALLTNPAE